MSGPTATARFDGNVHGVVVQTSRRRPSSSSNHTVTAGSWRSRDQAAIRVLELDPHGDGGLLAVAVRVVHPRLEVRQRRLALPAVGEDAVALVEQALVE